MNITREEVEKVAHLARLDLEETELQSVTGQMDAILAYVEKLNELNTDDIVPTAHAVPMENAFRDDIIKPSLPIEKVLQNAPDATEDAFKVPQVIE